MVKKIFKNQNQGMHFYCFQKSYIAGVFICLSLFFISCDKSKLDNPLSIGDSSFFAMQGLRCAMGQDSVFCPHENPWVISVSPADSTTSVSIQNTITVTFNKFMNSSTLTTQGSDGTCSGSFQVSANDFSSCVGGTLTSSNPSFTFTPNPNLCVGNTYKVKITTAAKDLVGNSFSSDYVTSGFSTINPKVGSGTDGDIYTFYLNCNILYVGGNFNLIGGQPRDYLGAIDLVSGTATSWNPSPDGRVNTVFYLDDVLYVGGSFSMLGGQSRNLVGAFNTTTGGLTAWNPSPGGAGSVSSIYATGSIIFIGGSFPTIGGQTINNIGAVDKQGSVLSFNPNSDGEVRVITQRGNQLYFGGTFNNVNGTPRFKISAWNLDSDSLSVWDPGAGGMITNISSIVFLTDTLYLGGSYSMIGGQSRNNFSEINLVTGLATSLTMNTNNLIISITKKLNTVYLGGSFTTVGGQSRNYLASFYANTGVVSNWNSNVDNYVNKISIEGNILFVGGGFANISGQPRGGIAAFDEASGSLLP